MEEESIIGLGNIFSKDKASILKWLMSKGLLHENVKCRTCGNEMKLSEYRPSPDGFNWRCRTGSCKEKRSVRSDSLFENWKLSLPQATYLLFFYARDTPAYVAYRLLAPDVSYKTVKVRYRCIREKIANYNKKCPIVFEENEDVTFAVDENLDVESKEEDPPVELDESFFRKKWKPSKNGQGKRHKKIIVFGIVQRKGTKCVMKVVDNTQKSTLLPIIEQYVPKSAHIFHDGHASYQNLQKIGYSHSTVNHSVEFVAPDGSHTNTIEGLWGLTKQRIARMHGLSTANSLDLHLQEFCFRQNFSINGDIFKKLITILL